MFFVLTLIYLAVVGAASLTSEPNNTHCSDGCQERYGGLTCQACVAGCFGGRCSQHCSNCDREECHRETGSCYRCKPGYYGETCDTRCPEHCWDTTTKRHAFCDRHTGRCLQTCTEGYFGESCEKQCPGFCVHSICDKQSGHCLRGCQRGRRGPRCNELCPASCLRGKCHADGTCKDGCRPGFYGLTCDQTCSNCYSSGCDRLSGRCDQCRPGHWGDKCNETCNKGCYTERDGSTNCHRGTGTCSGGCKDGWYGTHCNHNCNPTCKTSLCFRDGSCFDGCKNGWKGSFCNEACPSKCLNNTCNDDGRCTHGCKPGFTGATCGVKRCASPDCYQVNPAECDPGFYGDTCELQCSSNCKAGPSNLKQCHKVTGSCSHGCLGGWHGDDCRTRCNRQRRSVEVDKDEIDCLGQPSKSASDKTKVTVVLLPLMLWNLLTSDILTVLCAFVVM